MYLVDFQTYILDEQKKDKKTKLYNNATLSLC